MAKTLARFRGVCLKPGISRNARLYERSTIAKAVELAQERIASGGPPISVLTHHAAGDDSTRIIGRVVSMKLEEDGSASYEAELADTEHARTLLSLIDTDGGAPFLQGVSIRGAWLGGVKYKMVDGQRVEHAPELELDGLDFTRSPGVPEARIDSVSRVVGSPSESAHGRTVIYESVDDAELSSVSESVEAITEEAPAEAYSAGQKRDMADKGQAMKNVSGEPSYPIKSKSDLRKAIRAVGRGGADHDKIRAHIAARAKALGLSSMIPDNWNKDGSMKENNIRLGEIREYYPDGPDNGAGFCIDAYNGPISLTMRACGIDPAELRVITTAAMTAAVDALQAMDPDMDADIDVDGAPDGDNGETDGASPDDDMESAPANDALTETTPAIPAEETDTTLEVPAVSEPTTPAAETASTPMIALTQEQFTQLLDRITPARETAPATGELATETAPLPEQVAETDEQRIARLVAERVTAAKDELREQMLRENGLPPRTGYRVHESEQTAADKDDVADLYANRAEILLGEFGRTPQPAQ